MEDFLIRPEEDLLDPKEDIVFKSMLTMKSEESRGALKAIVSAFTERKVSQLNVAENEPQGGNKHEKHARLDINCVLDDKHPANIEMTMDAQGSEFVRLEQYVARLFGNITAQGLAYEDFPDAYQISIIGNKNFDKSDNEIVNFYGMCNLRTKKPIIDGKMHIITAELKKFKYNNKPIEEMDSKERWSAFLAWFEDKTKIDKINKLLKLEEGITMATEALRSVSNSELLRLAINSRKNSKEYWGNQLATVKKEGKKEGITIGLQKGKKEEKLEIARKMLAKGMSIEDISDFTELSPDEIKSLQTYQTYYEH